jgi:hypothetical protein
MDVGEVRVADIGLLIPLEHRVNGLGQFGAAALVDAAHVAVFESLMASTDLDEFESRLTESSAARFPQALQMRGFFRLFSGCFG